MASKTPPEIRFTIYGEAVSKGNSKKIIHLGRSGTSSLGDTPPAKAFKQACARFTPILKEPWICDVRVDLVMFYGSRRKDLDGSLVYDGMEKRVIGNDRQVKEKHEYWRLDRACPRIEVTVTPWEGALFDDG